MKTRIFLLAVIGLFIFSGCNENTTVETAKCPIEGLWLGSFTVDNDPLHTDTYSYSFSIFPDGSVLTKSLGADGKDYFNTGTWRLSADSVFSATIVSINFPGPAVTENITAKYSASGVMTNGKWTEIANGSQSGKFSTMKALIKNTKDNKKYLNSFLSQASEPNNTKLAL
jgi:hypothetical protein